MRHQRVAIIGGTGFVGRHLSCELARRRHDIRIITRRRERERALLVIPTLELVEADVHSTASLSAALRGCDAVINLAGILHGRTAAGQSFEDVHATLPEKVAEAARFNRISRLLHMSALGASAGAPSQYLRTKAAGEAAAHAQQGMAVTSFQPSVIFGPEDGFFNLFARLVKLGPPVIPLACPDARFQPVYVQDVAQAFAACLDHKTSFGQRYQLGGPRVYTLRQLVQYVVRVLGLRRWVLGLPDGVARLQARVLEHVPGKPFTMDNYLSMQVPNVCTDDGLERLGITPTSVEAIVPGYLTHSGGRGAFYGRLRTLARRS